METRELLKAIDDMGATIVDPVSSLHWLEFYRSYLIDELWATLTASQVLDKVARYVELRELPNRDDLWIAADKLVKMIEMRHGVKVGELGSRDHSKIIEQTECDFFGGIQLSSVVRILDTLYILLNSEQDRQG